MHAPPASILSLRREEPDPEMKRTNSAALFRSGWMIFAVVLLAAIFLSINWYYYNLTRNGLDEELGSRLRALAALVSAGIDPADLPLPGPAGPGDSPPDTLVSGLLGISSDFSLSSIMVVREDGVILLSTRADLLPPGEPFPNWNMDYSAIIGALEGTPSSTQLYRAANGTYMKAGYAPAPPGEAPAPAFVAVEASADFLGGLQSLRRVLLAATAVSIAGIALFTWFILKATGSLIRARESLMRSETLASMGRMAAGIAHEIRNPLFIIRSSAEKLKDLHSEDSEEIESFILEEVDRLNATLTDYLLFARDEPTSRQRSDLNAILQRSVRLIGESAQREGIEISTRFELDEAPFHGEEKRLQQSFLNILLNAQQSMENGGRIDVSISSAGGEYMLVFRDTGPGIPEKELGRIFEPFYTTKSRGSGLGLAIVKRVVEEHGGRIDLESRPGAGTSVTVTLPGENAKTRKNDEQNIDCR